MIFKKYGYSTFRFEILEVCSNTELNEFEKEYIDNLDDDDYNIAGTTNKQLPKIETIVVNNDYPSIKKYSDEYIQNIRNYIESKYNSGDVVNSKDIRTRFNLNDRQWAKIKCYLGGVVLTTGTKTYYKRIK